MYKTFVIEYSPSADKLAGLLEQKANDLEKDGFEVVSFSVTNSAKAVVLARIEDGSHAE